MAELGDLSRLGWLVARLKCRRWWRTAKHRIRMYVAVRLLLASTGLAALAVKVAPWLKSE